MANIKSAKKRAKQSEKRNLINTARRSAVKTAIKKVLTSLAQNDDAETTKKLFVQAQSQIARAKGKGVLHTKTAARKVSRLAKKCNVVEAVPAEAPKKKATTKKPAVSAKAKAKTTTKKKDS